MFSYGGVGASALESPTVRDWLCLTHAKALADPRIERFGWFDISDTPITMSRNQAALYAVQNDIDVLVMCDSDMYPDLYQNTDANKPGYDPFCKPFWDSSFDYLYNHYEKGPVSLFAPYCGPNPHPIHGGESCVYIFQWVNLYNGPAESRSLRLEMYPRSEATRMLGVHPVDGAGTGLCMWDVRLFKMLDMPWFEYEWKDDGLPCPHCHVPKPGPRAYKASTEDCVHTRDMSMVGFHKLGYNPVLCNWDAWAGHWKPWCVGKPVLPTMETVNQRFVNAVRRNQSFFNKMVYVTPDGIEDDGRFAHQPAGASPNGETLR